MFSLSQTTGYAILALSCLDKGRKKWVILSDIVDRTQIPQPYLVKVLKKLSLKGLVSTKRGYQGGVSLKRPPTEITLLDVAEAIEGSNVLPDCILGFKKCVGTSICPTFPFWREERERMRGELKKITVADLKDPSDRFEDFSI
ncbi:MAG: Rrf2 family transcriptional regulator [Candidatus Omnitrophica bacterium]|nr:Rrf2 family transcriptional regulator [Candidatus Omnitrophota bacterium]